MPSYATGHRTTPRKQAAALTCSTYIGWTRSKTHPSWGGDLGSQDCPYGMWSPCGEAFTVTSHSGSEDAGVERLISQYQSEGGLHWLKCGSSNLSDTTRSACSALARRFKGYCRGRDGDGP